MRLPRLTSASDPLTEPKSALLLGAHGVGKTSWVTRFADLNDGSLIRIDSDSLSSNGYVDADASALVNLLDVDAEASFVVFLLDEVDMQSFSEIVLDILVNFIHDIFDFPNAYVLGTAVDEDDVPPALRNAFLQKKTIRAPSRLERVAYFSDAIGTFFFDETEREAFNYLTATRGNGYGYAELGRVASMFASSSILNARTLSACFDQVKPSSIRYLQTHAPQSAESPVVGLAHEKSLLEAYVVEPMRTDAALYVKGVLLYGDSGNGKTHLVNSFLLPKLKNLCTVLSVDSSTLVSKTVGDSERAVSRLFRAARASAPCVLFLDRVERIAPKRVPGEAATTERTFERVLSVLLTEMDGVLRSSERVVLVCATSDPRRVDDALLRSGRIDVHVGIPPPSELEDVKEIVEASLPRGSNRDALDATCFGILESDAELTRAFVVHACRRVAMNVVRRRGSNVALEDVPFEFSEAIRRS